jgi:hypothetical protein
MTRSTDTWLGRPWRVATRRCRSQHAFGAAGVHHDRASAGRAASRRSSGATNAAMLAGAAVFGRQHEIDVEVTKEVQAGRASEHASRRRKSVERTCRARRALRRGCKRSQADAAGNHPGLGRGLDRRERPAERSQHADALAVGRRCIEQRRVGSDAFVQERDSRRRAPSSSRITSKTGKRPREQRVVAGARV